MDEYKLTWIDPEDVPTNEPNAIDVFLADKTHQAAKIEFLNMNEEDHAVIAHVWNTFRRDKDLFEAKPFGKAIYLKKKLAFMIVARDPGKPLGRKRRWYERRQLRRSTT